MVFVDPFAGGYVRGVCLDATKQSREDLPRGIENSSNEKFFDTLRKIRIVFPRRSVTNKIRRRIFSIPPVARGSIHRIEDETNTPRIVGREKRVRERIKAAGEIGIRRATRYLRLSLVLKSAVLR